MWSAFLKDRKEIPLYPSTTLFKKVVGDAQLDDLELDRAHCSLGPKPTQGSWPIIIRFHRYTQKEHVAVGDEKPGRRVPGIFRIFEDFSTNLAKKRASFNKVKSLLYKDGIRFGLLYPARLRVTVNDQSHIFDSAEAAESFYKQHKK